MTNHLIHAAIVFGANFAVVLALGWQQKNVHGDHQVAAFFTGILIGASQLAGFKLMPDAGWLESIAYILGGCIGIIVAMRSHKHIVRKNPRIGRDGPPPVIPKKDFVTLERVADRIAHQKALERGELNVPQPQGYKPFPHTGKANPPPRRP